MFLVFVSKWKTHCPAQLFYSNQKHPNASSELARRKFPGGLEGSKTLFLSIVQITREFTSGDVNIIECHHAHVPSREGKVNSPSSFHISQSEWPTRHPNFDLRATMYLLKSTPQCHKHRHMQYTFSCPPSSHFPPIHTNIYSSPRTHQNDRDAPCCVCVYGGVYGVPHKRLPETGLTGKSEFLGGGDMEGVVSGLSLNIIF